jgi:hypothetical protein
MQVAEKMDWKGLKHSCYGFNLPESCHYYLYRVHYHSQSLHSANIAFLWFLHDAQNKQQLFPCTTNIRWSSRWKRGVFCEAGTDFVLILCRYFNFGLKTINFRRAGPTDLKFIVYKHILKNCD